MGKPFVRQHIVPKRYLDRFASQREEKSIIGTRMYKNNEPYFFLEATSNVGYIKNYYDVTDKDDSKYWEHFFAENIDYLYGTEIRRIISKATLSPNDIVILDEHDKEVLSRAVVAQMLRVPSSIDYMKEIYPRVEKEAKDIIISALPPSLANKYRQKIQDTKLDEQWQKEQFLNLSFAPERYDRYCKLAQDRIWVVYVNTYRNSMPFVTSDNPVLVERIGRKEIGLFKNGLVDPATCIFYPLSPSVSVASYSKDGIFSDVIDEVDGKKELLNELGFIIDKNIKIMEQAYRQSFIPQPFFDRIMNEDTEPVSWNKGQDIYCQGN
ncbi:MAG: DUF4238 domain-containing protein [Bacillota bacterium]|nr:DUF4238 domain-containing protein [Bacillota bacterium]